MVDQVPIDSPYETFSDVAKELFCDGIYNWGRIVTLFYFTYKLIMKVCLRKKMVDFSFSIQIYSYF
jgi:apoptosis regulator BAX